jgi:hypothetical protein
MLFTLTEMCTILLARDHNPKYGLLGYKMV